MEDNNLNPTDVQKGLVMLSGCSPSEARQALLNTFYSKQPPPPPTGVQPLQSQFQTPLPVSTITEIPLIPPPLDTGGPIQAPGDGGQPGTQIECTGVLNGVAATATLLGTGDPTPI